MFDPNYSCKLMIVVIEIHNPICMQKVLYSGSGFTVQACPPSLPDIRQAGGRRVWARG